MTKQPMISDQTQRNQKIATDYLLEACFDKLFSQSNDPRSVSHEIIKFTEEQLTEIERNFAAKSKSRKEAATFEGDANEIRQIIQQLVNQSLADYRKGRA